ncbi:hypothetical protein Hanom_Chr15g01366771 [Helianthus anomalus]
MSEVILVVIELRDVELEPPTILAAPRHAHLQALGLAQPQDRAQNQAHPPPLPPSHSPPADHVIDNEIPPPPPLHPPQYPQHVYTDLPPAAQAVARDFNRRIRRSERYQMWIIETLTELWAHAGLPPHPLPPSPPLEDQ